MQESWPFTLEYRKSDTKYRITAASDAKLNLLMTPASFTSFRDVIDFSYALFGTQNSLTEIVKRENCENSSSDDRGLACRYIYEQIMSVQMHPIDEFDCMCNGICLMEAAWQLLHGLGILIYQQCYVISRVHKFTMLCVLKVAEHLRNEIYLLGRDGRWAQH